MDIILSKYAVLEWPLRRPVTIVKDSESLMIQNVCMIENRLTTNVAMNDFAPNVFSSPTILR